MTTKRAVLGSHIKPYAGTTPFPSERVPPTPQDDASLDEGGSSDDAEAPEALDAQAFELTDLGNARRLIALHGYDFRFVPELRRWLVWDGCRWATDVTGEIDRRAKQTIDQFVGLLPAANDHDERKRLVAHYVRSQSAPRLNAMVQLATTEPSIPVRVDELDADPMALNTPMGTVDLRTGTLRAHRREDLCTQVTRAPYAPDATCAVWIAFLDQVFAGDASLIDYLQRLCGYLLTGEVSEHVLVDAYGEGSNGKSTLLNAIKWVMGNYAIAIDPRLLADTGHPEHPTGIADLRGARLALTTEVERGRRLAESLVKLLTGGDSVRARRMRTNYFEFEPTHKLVICGNYLPRVAGTDEGIWRRIHVLPFEQSFTGSRRDLTLAKRLEGEGAGILAWMVQGCLAWQAHGLDAPNRVREATSSYREQEDHLGRFLADCTAVEASGSVAAGELRAAYEAWCKEQGERPWSAKALGGDLTRRGYERRRGSKRAWTWFGFALVTVG